MYCTVLYFTSLPFPSIFFPAPVSAEHSVVSRLGGWILLNVGCQQQLDTFEREQTKESRREKRREEKRRKLTIVTSSQMCYIIHQKSYFTLFCRILLCVMISYSLLPHSCHFLWNYQSFYLSKLQMLFPLFFLHFQFMNYDLFVFIIFDLFSLYDLIWSDMIHFEQFLLCLSFCYV